MNIPPLSRNRRFWLFWGGQSLSKIGDKLHYIALMWFVVNRTESGMAMGGVLLASSLPIVLFAPKAGVLIDRLNRKWVLAAADLLRAAAALGIGFTTSSGPVNYPLLLLFTALMAVGTAFFQPALNALLPMLVRQEDLLRANSVNESATQLAGIAGPVLAGVCLSFAAPHAVFYLNALSFLIGAAAVLPLSVKKREAAAQGEFGGFKEGLRYLMSKPALRDLVLTFAVLNFAVSFMEVYIPFLNKEGFGGGPQELGLIFSAIFAGALLSSLGLMLKKDISQQEKVIGGSICLMGLAFAAIFVFRERHAALGLFLLIGMSWGTFNTNARVFMQKTVEDERRGRVFALISAVSNVMMPLAYGLAGLATSILPVYSAFLLGGLVVLTSGVYLFSRRFNHAERECAAQSA